MIAAILAASISFTATATGVEKGKPVEFAFAGANTDRDYETMFLIDDTVDGLCRKLENAGLRPGRPTDQSSCCFWPVGTPVRFEPSLTNFVEATLPQGLTLGQPIYTGGKRSRDGARDANTNMPASVFAFYTLAQSPFLFDGYYDQGSIYGAFTACAAIKKGERVSFTVSWDEGVAPTKSLHLTVKPGASSKILKTLKGESEKGPVDALIGFADDLTVAEATAIANALATVDSPRIKINGCSNIYYRAFLPLVKWRDRKERLVQPFELTLGDPDRLLFIKEDWSVEGPDPRLEPIDISFDRASSYDRTDTCFIFADPEMPLSRIYAAMIRLKGSCVKTWYVFTKQ